MVKKSGIKAAEDATIVTAEGLTVENDKAAGNDSKMSDSQGSRFYKYFDKRAISFFVAQIIVFIAISFGFFYYYESQNKKDRSLIITKIDSRAPLDSINAIEKKLVSLEIDLKDQNIQHVEKSILDFEKKLLNKTQSTAGKIIDKDKIAGIERSIARLEVSINSIRRELQILKNANEELQVQQPFDEVYFKNRIEKIETKSVENSKKMNLGLNGLESDINQIKKDLIDFRDFQKNKISNKKTADIKRLNDMRESFGQLAFVVLKNEIKGTSDGKILSNIVTSLKSAFVMRSKAPREGLSTDAILSRAENHFTLGNFEKCLEELMLLNTREKNVFSEWIKELEELIKE